MDMDMGINMDMDMDMNILARTTSTRPQHTAKKRGNWETFDPKLPPNPVNITDYTQLSPFYNSENYFTMIDGVYSFQQNDKFACGYYSLISVLFTICHLQLGEIPEAIKKRICIYFKIAFFREVRGERGMSALDIIRAAKSVGLDCLSIYTNKDAMNFILRPNINLLLDTHFRGHWTGHFPKDSEDSYLMDPATGVVYSAKTSRIKEKVKDKTSPEGHENLETILVVDEGRFIQICRSLSGGGKKKRRTRKSRTRKRRTRKSRTRKRRTRKSRTRKR